MAAPAHTTIRQWLCKLGLYLLERPKQAIQGWFYIIDTTIQMGSQRCVVVLGVKKESLSKNFCPTREQVEPLALRPLTSSKGELINEVLHDAFKKTGKPIAIVSDEGADLKKGVRLFTEQESTIHLFDVSHKVNNCLKKELAKDKIWKRFQKASNAAVQHLKLSSLAHLAPPKQRTKDRMHSAFPLVEWGLRLSNFLKSEDAKKISSKDKDKVLWIEKYQGSLEVYKCLMKISQAALKLVHAKGYYRYIVDDFNLITEQFVVNDFRCSDFRRKVAEILQKEGKKIPDGQHYLGSSEIIESMFGKFKEMESHHSSSGLSSLILAIPALACKIDENEIQKAMRTVSTSVVNSWIKEKMGQTFLSKRRTCLKKLRKAETVKYSDIDLDNCELHREFAMQN